MQESKGSHKCAGQIKRSIVDEKCTKPPENGKYKAVMFNNGSKNSGQNRQKNVFTRKYIRYNVEHDDDDCFVTYHHEGTLEVPRCRHRKRLLLRLMIQHISSHLLLLNRIHEAFCKRLAAAEVSNQLSDRENMLHQKSKH